MVSSIGLHNFADVIFGVTQKPLYIHHYTWSDNKQLIKEFFLASFVIWRATGH